MDSGAILTDGEFATTDAKTLAVVLHGWDEAQTVIHDVTEAIAAFYAARGGADIYAPTMRYTKRSDPTGANDIVTTLVAKLDDIWARSGRYEQVVFVGHGIGGTLLRRVFLAGAPHPDDYAGAFAFRDDLFEDDPLNSNRRMMLLKPHAWATKVERLVLLATWERGWTLSDAVSWRYAFWLGLLGFWGRIVELADNLEQFDWWRGVAKNGLARIGLRKYGRTLLDMRCGSVFVVQTRLLWMAYRRWHNPEHVKTYNEIEASHAQTRAEADAPRSLTLNPPPPYAIDPIVVQLIGTQDSLVAPQDQVDCDVEGGLGRDGKFFLLEMPETDHDLVAAFSVKKGERQTDDRIPKLRKKIFMDALLCDAQHKSNHAIEPARFLDTVVVPQPDVTDVVFIMHGIRDDGYWTHRIAKAVKEYAEEFASKSPTEKRLKFETFTSTYGYFPMGAFILTWLRQEKVEWFMNCYVAARARYPLATMHFIGHSNGTYIGAKALEDYNAVRFGRVYFAGSVVHTRTDVAGLMRRGSLARLHNVPGANDCVVAWLPKSLEYFTDLGAAGWDHFAELKPGTPLPPQITRSDGYAKTEKWWQGHGAAIQEPHWGEIAKFIVGGETPFGFAQRPDLFSSDRLSWMIRLARVRIGIPLGFSIVALFVLLVVGLWLLWKLPRWGFVDLLGGDGFAVWLAALVSFLGLQYVTNATPTRDGVLGRAWLWLYAKVRPDADPVPIWKVAWGGLSLALLIICGAGVANLFLTSLCMIGWDLEGVVRAAGASFTLAALAYLIKFVLTRF